MDAERISADVHWLADDAREGRGAGTQGLDAAALWLADAFRGAGLAPGGDDGGYQQRFEMPISLRVVRETLRAGDEDFAAQRDFAALLSSGDGDARGRLVFAGYGIAAPELGYDDWEGVPAAGAVVLVLEDHPGGDLRPFAGVPADAFSTRAHKISNARDRGARAVLLAPRTGDADDVALPQAAAPSTTPSQRSSGIPVLSLTRAAAERLVALAGGESLAARQRRIDDALRPASELLPGVDIELAVDLERGMGSSANVIGLLEGSDPRLRAEAVVVGAHYDHLGRGEFGSLTPERRGEIHNGADDNASGTAGVLELARVFAQGPRPRRSLVFAAFAGEEFGLFGSSAYVEAPPFPLSDTVAMLNLDMIGRLRRDSLTVFGTGSSPDFPRLVRRAFRELSLDAAFSEDAFTPSDQTSFYARGVPVLMFFTGAHPQYHTPEDDASLIDAAGTARVLDGVYRVARALADADSRPELVAAATAPPSRGGSGYGPYLGTVPSFGEGELPGVVLQGVAPGSPAERAGLRAGDRIVSFDGASIENLEEYAARLSAARPGQEVRIGLLRDGRLVETVATLGRRR
jgi:hypothetical protein